MERILGQCFSGSDGYVDRPVRVKPVKAVQANLCNQTKWLERTEPTQTLAKNDHSLRPEQNQQGPMSPQAIATTWAAKFCANMILQ